MEGYNKALGHFDARFKQDQNEGYKYGWTNCLTVLKVEQNNPLWKWYDPGLLDLEDPPFRLDVNWIPANTIPQALISKCLGDYGLYDELEIV